MKCPHCQKNIKEPKLENAERNVENYGSGTFIFQCHHCKKKYGIYIYRVVKRDKPYKVNDDTDLSY